MHKATPPNVDVSKIYETLNQHAVAIGKIDSNVNSINSTLIELSKKTSPDYRWVWGAIGVIYAVVSGYTSLVLNPMSERMISHEKKQDELNRSFQDAQLRTLREMNVISYTVGTLNGKKEKTERKDGE